MFVKAVFRGSRARRTRGAELIEFTIVFLPLLAMTAVLLDTAWAVFVKATLQYAVRTAVRQGITITGTQAKAANSDLTAMVKNVVQKHSLGLLRSTSNKAKIKVHYLQPPAPGSTGPAVDVSTQPSGNKPLYIMQVSVESYPLPALLPRLYSWRKAADKNPTVLTVRSADLIEPSTDVPPIGVAP
jgi:Flp pilus assembly protein TadG